MKILAVAREGFRRVLRGQHSDAAEDRLGMMLAAEPIAQPAAVGPVQVLLVVLALLLLLSQLLLLVLVLGCGSYHQR